MNLNKRIGVMQGRLSPQYSNFIQCFPTNHWYNEFRIANKLNFKLIEWTLDYKNFYKNPIFLKKEVKKIKYLKKKYQIKIESLTGDCFMQKPFWKLKNKKYIKLFIDTIKACGYLKIKYIIIPLVDNGSIKKKNQEKKLINVLLKNINLISSNKVCILFETDLIPKNVKKFIDKLPSKYFGINYDSGNSAALNYDIDEEFKIYGKNIKNIHIKDRLLKGKTVRLGLGNLDFKKLYKNLNKINYDQNIILQTARGKKNKDIEEIKINLDFLKKKKI